MNTQGWGCPSGHVPQRRLPPFHLLQRKFGFDVWIKEKLVLQLLPLPLPLRRIRRRVSEAKQALRSRLRVSGPPAVR